MLANTSCSISTYIVFKYAFTPSLPFTSQLYGLIIKSTLDISAKSKVPIVSSSNGVLVLGELARNPEKMKTFDMFSRITDTYFENTATDFNKKLVILS